MTPFHVAGFSYDKCYMCKDHRESSTSNLSDQTLLVPALSLQRIDNHDGGDDDDNV